MKVTLPPDLIKGLASSAKDIAKDAMQNLAVPKANVERTMEQVEPETVKKLTFKDRLKQLGKGAMNLIGKIAPEVAGFIPGIGPIAKMALSTLNDDEWFEEYAPAGATFNELLADTKFSKEGRMRLITPAMAVFKTSVLKDSPNPTSTFKDQYLPVILAYVRKKTNNVLVASENDYWVAFVTASRLYAIYYTLKKYVDLVEDLPTNIPALTGTLPLVSPANYSAIVGVVTSLENYLKITIKLPYAWTEYLRWRFGTLFLSENTGKPGIISYDYENLDQAGDNIFSTLLTPVAVSQFVDSEKASLAACSRATADINLAFAAHQCRYSVEKRHYDEKEFNLRCNLRSDRTEGIPSESVEPLGTLLYLDSRLNQNAAIQAVTLSCDSDVNWAPFHIGASAIAWYVAEAYDIPYYNKPADEWKTATTYQGWHVSDFSVSVHGTTTTISVDTGQGAYVSDVATALGAYSPSAWAANTEQAAALLAYYAHCVRLCLNALQIHNEDWIDIVGSGAAVNKRLVIKSKLLSYDSAIIAPTQVGAIHRLALRNLFRGEYTNKKPASANKPLVDGIEQVVETTQEAIVDSLPKKVI